jgi:hypothetical protein
LKNRPYFFLKLIGQVLLRFWNYSFEILILRRNLAGLWSFSEWINLLFFNFVGALIVIWYVWWNNINIFWKCLIVNHTLVMLLKIILLLLGVFLILNRSNWSNFLKRRLTFIFRINADAFVFLYNVLILYIIFLFF